MLQVLSSELLLFVAVVSIDAIICPSLTGLLSLSLVLWVMFSMLNLDNTGMTGVVRP